MFLWKMMKAPEVSIGHLIGHVGNRMSESSAKIVDSGKGKNETDLESSDPLAALRFVGTSGSPQVWPLGRENSVVLASIDLVA